MKNKFKLFYFLCLTSGVLFAQPPIEKVHQLLQEIHQKNPEIGISIGLLYENKMQYSNIGTLQRNGDHNINEHSLFEIASITKSVTGILIAQAIQEGKISPSDFIEDHLPNHFKLNKAIQKTITIADLASHQSGLPDIDFPKLIAEDPQQPVQSITQKIIIEMVNNCTKLKDHGTYRYSTIGFILLGQLLEQLYGQSYAAILKERLIGPLGLKRTLTTDFNVPNTTSAYNAEGGSQEFFKWNIAAPAGLVKSTAADMLTYLDALLSDDGLLHAASRIAEERYYSDDNISIGLGINILSDASDTIYAKTGDSMGQSSIMAYNKKGKWAIVLFLNQHNSKLRNQLFNTIYELF